MIGGIRVWYEKDANHNVYLVQDNLTCVRVSKDPGNPWHQLHSTSGQPRAIVQRVVEDKDEEDVELLVERPTERRDLDPIDGAVALAVRADKLVFLPVKKENLNFKKDQVFLPSNVILKWNSYELLVSSVKLQPIVAVNLGWKQHCAMKMMMI